MQIPIVIVAYNRPASLARLLKSVEAAEYPHDVKLIISIDKSDTGEVLELANQFEWKYGEKEIIAHEQHLGLKEHVLSCGDLSLKYDGVIILEDDLYVSPAFYDFTMQAAAFYSKDENINGISLYSHCYNETAYLPFIPMTDNSDVFFMQIPASWGQCFLKSHWQAFKKWYTKNKSIGVRDSADVPKNIDRWPESSWKKYFFLFMIDKNLFFVYPRFSLTTNFGDPGTHFDQKYFFQQVPLLYEKRYFNLKKFENSYAVYDSHCEVLAHRLVKLSQAIAKYNFTVDLYAAKQKKHIKTPYILTSRPCANPIFSFSRELIPIETNIIHHIPGNELTLAKTKDCDFSYEATTFSIQKLSYFFKLREFQFKQIAESNEMNYEKTKLIEKLNHELKNKEKDIENFKNTIENINKHVELKELELNCIENQLQENNRLIEQWQELVKHNNGVVEELRRVTGEKDRIFIEQTGLLLQKDELIRQKDAIIELEIANNKRYAETIEIQRSEMESLIELTKTHQAEISVSSTIIQESQTRLKELTQHSDALLKIIHENANLLTLQQSEISALHQHQLDLQQKFNALENDLILKEKQITEQDGELKLKQESINQLIIKVNQLEYSVSRVNAEAAETEKSLTNLVHQRDQKINELMHLIRQIERSYTFRIGKMILWPVKKLIGKK